jgi:hypothetical protein
VALPYIHFDAYNRDINGVLSLAGFDTLGAEYPPEAKDRRDDLVLDVAYQRGSVWSEEKQRNLVKSVLMGVPFGSIYLNHRHILEPFVVVDGKQRIEALIAFVKDELWIPAEWVEENRLATDPTAGRLHFSDLNVTGKRFFMSRPCPTLDTKLKTEAEERDLYLLINYGGLAHEEPNEEQLTRLAELGA